MNHIQHNQIVNFIWGIADDVLRDVYTRGKYRDIILPFTVLRRPFVPDAWIDHSKAVKGYEISFTKIFYKYQPLRSVKEITSEIMKLENETEGLLKEIID